MDKKQKIRPLFLNHYHTGLVNFKRMEHCGMMSVSFLECSFFPKALSPSTLHFLISEARKMRTRPQFEKIKHLGEVLSQKLIVL